MYQNDTQNNLEKRFSVFKKFVEKMILNIVHFGNKQKKTFEVDFRNENYKSGAFCFLTHRPKVPVYNNFQKVCAKSVCRLFFKK